MLAGCIVFLTWQCFVCLSGNSWTYSGLNKFNINSLLMHVPALGFLVAIAKRQTFLLCTLSCVLSFMVVLPLPLLPPLFAHFFFAFTHLSPAPCLKGPTHLSILHSGSANLCNAWFFFSREMCWGS